MPFICKSRTDIVDGVLQVTDLWPNISQRNSVLDPQGQGPLYLRDPQNDTVVTLGADPITTAAEYQGVAAYLIDRVEGDDAVNDIALTAAQANAIAATLIATMEAGGALTLAAVDAILGAAVATVTLTGGTSTATLLELLQVMCGGVYILPAGSQLETGATTFDPSVSGAFAEGKFLQTFATDGLTISFNVGVLSFLVDAAFDFQGTAGAAAVVYNDDGTLFA